MAEYLCGLGTDVAWGTSGPDLSVHIEGERWFVECYAYRKCFGLMLFIEEVLRQLNGYIRVQYNLCLPFRLPSNKLRTDFLNTFLSPFRNARFVEDALSRAADAHPVVLCEHDGRLVVYVEGSDPDSYVPGRVPNQTGDPQRFLEVALREAVCAKQNANSLAAHHPNMVATNYALSADFQLALNRADDLGLSLPSMELGNIDALAIAAAGIDERLA